MNKASSRDKAYIVIINSQTDLVSFYGTISRSTVNSNSNSVDDDVSVSTNMLFSLCSSELSWVCVVCMFLTKFEKIRFLYIPIWMPCPIVILVWHHNLSRIVGNDDFW